MRRNERWNIGLAVLALLVLPMMVLAAEPAPQAEPAQKLDPMMEAWIKAGTPGKQHELLATLAGHWRAKARFWMEPGAPTQESKGRTESIMVLGGRFLHSEYIGTMGGQPFTGIAFLGFNNVSGLFESIWMDEMSTLIYWETGQLTEDDKVLTMTGRYPDPLTGRERSARHVTRISGPNLYVMEMYDAGPDGKEFLSAEITYSRVK